MLKDSLVYLMVRLVNGVLSLGAICLLTRLLSAEEYGRYALGVAGIGICASVFFQWIAVSVSRFYAAHEGQPQQLLGEAHRLAMGVAAMIVLATAVFMLRPPMATLTPAFALAIGMGSIAMGFFSVSLQVANAQGQALRYGLLTTCRGALALLFALIAVHSGFGGVGAVFGMALAGAVAVIFLGARVAPARRSASLPLRRQIVVYGLPLTLTYLAIMVLDLSDRLMIGWQLGPAAVAGYAASYDLAQQTVAALLNVLFLANYRRITAAWELGGTPAARRAMLALSRAMLLGVPWITGIFIGLAPDIARLAVGPAMQKDAAVLMPWVALAIGLGCLRSFFLDIAFQLVKATHAQLAITVAMAAVNVLLNLALLPSLGVLGAAISTAASFLLGTLLSWWFGRRLGLYPTPRRDVVSMVIALGGMVLGARLAPTDSGSVLLDLVIRATSGALLFVVVVIATDLSDFRFLLVQRLRLLKKSPV